MRWWWHRARATVLSARRSPRAAVSLLWHVYAIGEGMSTWLTTVCDNIRTSFWFLPALLTILAILLAVGIVTVDETFNDEVLQALGWVWSGGPEGAREVLATIASSMIGIAGVTFSITLVALSLASSQFGPRLLRNFMRDTGNQIVLGTFIATFVYCLLVLRTVRGDDGSVFVPNLAVTIGLLLAVVSLGVLIYFIHHVSMSIQAPQIIAVVAQELDEAMQRLFPERLGYSHSSTTQEVTTNDQSLQFSRKGHPVPAAGSGYLQAIDLDTLMQQAMCHDVLLQLHYRPGQFVVRGTPLMQVLPGERLTPELVATLTDTCVLGAERTVLQDVEYAFDQLMEIAVRALSPGVNDPVTALMCLDRLGAALCELSQREIPSAHRYDEHGQLRIIASPVTFAAIVELTFNPIRQYGRTNAEILLHLLDTISTVCAQTTDAGARAALVRQVEMIRDDSREGVPNPRDQQRVQAQVTTLSATLQSMPQPEARRRKDGALADVPVRQHAPRREQH